MGQSRATTAARLHEATPGYSRLQQSTRHPVARADVEETKAKAKPKQKKTKSKRNRSETKNVSQPERSEPKMEKKAILYFAINRKNCSFYCFQSVFCFSEGAWRLSSLRKFACGKQEAGTWHTRGKRCVSRQKEKKQKEVIEGKGGGGCLLACRTCRAGGPKISQLNVMHKSAFLCQSTQTHSYYHRGPKIYQANQYKSILFYLRSLIKAPTRCVYQSNKQAIDDICE